MSLGLSVGALAGGFAEGHTAAFFQNYIWENYILLVIGEEVYSRLQLVNNSCLGVALPLQEVNLQLAGFRRGGRGGAAVPACVHCGRGLCTSPRSIPPATARNQQVH